MTEMTITAVARRRRNRGGVAAAAVAGTLALPAPAGAFECPGTGQSLHAVDYTASSVPEEDAAAAWTALEEPAGSAFVEVVADGLYVDTITAPSTLMYYRIEQVGGLSDGFYVEVDTRLIGGDGFEFTAIGQDKVAAFRILIGPPDATGVPQGFVQLAGTTIGTFLDPTAQRRYRVEAVRDGIVRFFVDDALIGTREWAELPDLVLDGFPDILLAASDEVLVMFSSTRVEAVWSSVRYGYCGPERAPPDDNLELWLTPPSPPDGKLSCALRGGMGETLEDVTEIRARLDRIDVVHWDADQTSGEALLKTVWAGSEDVVLYTRLDDDSSRQLFGAVVPDGFVEQVRLVISHVELDLGGEPHDVRVPSGAESGIKVVTRGPVAVTTEEAVRLDIALDPCTALGRSRDGFWWDPVTTIGTPRPPTGPGRCGPLGEPCPPAGPRDPEHGPCVGPDCPRGPLDPVTPGHECPEGQRLRWAGPGQGFLCVPGCPEGYEWDASVADCVTGPPPACPERDTPTPPSEVPLGAEFLARSCVCTPGASGWQELPLTFAVRHWLNNSLELAENFSNNQNLTIELYGNTFVRRMGVHANRVHLARGDFVHLRVDDHLAGPFWSTIDEDSLPGWYDFPLAGRPEAQREGYYRFQFTSDEAEVHFGPHFDGLRVACRAEASSQPIPELGWPNPVLGVLLDTGDAVVFRVPAVGWRGAVAQTLLVTGDITASNPLTSDGQIHIFARRGAIPTPTEHDVAATAVSTDQLLILPGLSGDDPRAPTENDDWYVVVYAADGWGTFMLKRSVLARITRLRVGVDWDMAAASGADGVWGVESYLVQSGRAFFTASQGMSLIAQFDVHNDDRTCGGITRATCDVVLRRGRTGCSNSNTSCHQWRWVPITGLIRWVEIHRDHRLDPRRGPWSFSHELIHLLHQEPVSRSLDEHLEGRRRCGHSIMSGTLADRLRTVCTHFNHGQDHDPRATPEPPPDRWRRITESVDLWRIADKPRSLTARHLPHHEHGGFMAIQRINYFSHVDPPVAPP
jgi:hypothetical protein